jgi:hypothetical protein
VFIALIVIIVSNLESSVLAISHPMLSFSVVVVVEIDNLSSLLPGADFRKKEREVWMGRAKII